MSTEIVPPDDQGNKLIHFWPPEQCSRCSRLSTVAILDLAYEDRFTPVCAEHGYTGIHAIPATMRELSDGRVSIQRFVVWMHGDRQGHVVRLYPVHPDKVPGYDVRENDSLGDRAWAIRYEDVEKQRHDLFIVWSDLTLSFSLYRDGHAVHERQF